MSPLSEKRHGLKWIQCFAVALIAASLTKPVDAAPVGPAKQLIEHYKMELIPVEGAWFKVTYGSADKIPAEALPPRYGSSRIAGGAIYALVTREDFSALHKLKTDEIWHFYVGDPIELLLLYPDGRDEVIVLGADVLAGQQPQFTVPAGVWMGARPIKATAEAYGFFGTTMAPGFDYGDFEAGYRDELLKAYPQRRELIAELTRAELATRPAGAVSAPQAVVVPAGPTVFMPEAMASITMAPGMTLRELIGRVGHGKTERTSIARFALEPGKGTGMSYCKVGEEYFLIISGRGTAVVEGESTTVQAGSVVLLRPGVKHSLTAAADYALEFYAITTPAFSPEDYVPVK
jgi:predicted cupin superfamily sugar epimerase/mannose-6-phosphate isomerase-like protein (cupin superfamily)